MVAEEILQYEGLVKHITKKYNFRSDYDDLYQAGMMGLVTAFKKYDEKRESSFVDYAYFYIKGEVLKTINSDYQVKISSDTYKISQEISKVREELTQSLGRVPSTYEISFITGIDEDKINSVINAVGNSFSLDNNALDDNDNLYNKIALIEKGYDVGVLDLKDAINSLDVSERELINSRYYEDMTQSETANILGISQVQVSRKESKILEKLKTKIAA